MAVVDLGNCVLVLLPITAVLYADETWVLGDEFCAVFAVYVYSFVIGNILLINLLSFNKLIRCLLPLRTIAPTKKHKIVVTIIMLFFSLLSPIWIIYGLYIGNFMKTTFFRSQCTCSALFTENVQDWQKVIPMILSVVVNGIPCLVIVLTNAILVVYALKKSRSTVNKLNLLVVVLVTCSFLISIFPCFAYMQKMGTTHEDWGNDMTVRFVYFMTFLSAWSNPIVYLATNPSFREFTLKFICQFKVCNLKKQLLMRQSRVEDARTEEHTV
jgi:hypothetical protein